MSNLVPRIEYLNLTFTGDTTISSSTIADIADTTGISAGMLIDNANFPEGTTVLSVGVNSIVATNQATVTEDDASIETLYRIDFDYPPNQFDTYGDSTKYVGKISVSANGRYQTSFNYTEEERKLEFKFVTQLIKDSIQTFMDNHGGIGLDFRYYNDKDLTPYETYKIHKSSRKLRPARKFSQDLYTLKIRIRRVK